MIRCSIWDGSMHRKEAAVLAKPKCNLHHACFLTFKSQSAFKGGVLNEDTKLL